MLTQYNKRQQSRTMCAPSVALSIPKSTVGFAAGAANVPARCGILLAALVVTMLFSSNPLTRWGCATFLNRDQRLFTSGRFFFF